MIARGRAVLTLGVLCWIVAIVFGSPALYPVAAGLVLVVPLAVVWVRITLRQPHVTRQWRQEDAVWRNDELLEREPGQHAHRLGIELRADRPDPIGLRVDIAGRHTVRSRNEQERHGRQLDRLHPLACAPHERMTRRHLTRHVGAELRGEPAEVVLAERRRDQAVGRPQDSRRVRACTGQSRGNRYPLLDLDA